MPVKIDLSGLKKLSANAKRIDGQMNVKLTDIMTPNFIRNCSKFDNFQHFYDASIFKGSPEFPSTPNAQWDDFVSENTTFNSWEEMENEALSKYLDSELFRGI